jgi:uncharacterized cupin superfamily protein
MVRERSTEGDLKLVRVYADEAGDTHLADIEVPPTDDTAGGVSELVGLRGIPATTMSMSQSPAHRADMDFHTPAQRQVVAFLRGELEVTTTTGETRRLQAGDCLLADDVGSKGHISKDVGDEPWATLVVGISPDWPAPPG